MSRIIPIGSSKKRKAFPVCDIVKRGNGLEFESIWSKKEGALLFSPSECRRLLQFYSSESACGPWCDYRMDIGEKWIHFSLLSKGDSTLAIGKQKIGKRYGFFLYDSGRVIKKFNNLDSTLHYYVCYYKNKKTEHKA